MNTIDETMIGRGSVRFRGEYGLPSDAFAAMKEYRATYPSEVYGTLVTVHKDDDTQLWVVEGSRTASQA